MLVGLVTGEYPPMQGGVGAFTVQLGQALAELGHQVHVITGKLQGQGVYTQQGGLIAHRVMEGWGWKCWKLILDTAQALKLDVLNVQYQAAAYGMHPAINFVPATRGRPPDTRRHCYRSALRRPRSWAPASLPSS